MTVPTGAKIIRNKYSAKCHAGDGMVGADSGVAILDANITGRWTTFHLPCMPGPYELADVPVTVSIGTARNHNASPITPGHERCATCKHWAQDHTASHCTGSFNSAGGCTCTVYVPLPVATTTAATLTVPPTTGVATVNVGGYGAVAVNTQPGTTYQGAVPVDDTSFRLVVFYGMVKSALDGESHFVSANTVLDLHRITMLERARIPIEMVANDAKQLYRPRSGDYIIGPRYEPAEYAAASMSLGLRLEKEGIRD